MNGTDEKAVEILQPEERCLLLLHDLHKVLGYTDKVSLSEFARQHRLNQVVVKVLRDGGIVEETGREGHTRLYAWKAPRVPNEDMANELWRRVQNYNAVQAAKKSSEKTEDAAEVSVGVQRQTITKLFWGLITIERNHYEI